MAIVKTDVPMTYELCTKIIQELAQTYPIFRVKELTMRCDGPMPINLDGELRTADTVHIQMAKEKIRFFYPKELSYQLS